MSYRFCCRTRIIGVDPEIVFDLSLDPDVHVRSMDRHAEQMLDRTGTGLLALGDHVTWEARHFGVRWRMTSRITAWDRPDRFVDEQVRGPFRTFRHEHRFERDDDDVLMTDVVTLTAPLGPLGWVVERLGLGIYMRRLIGRRNESLKRDAESSPG